MIVGKIAKVQDFLVTANEDGEADINSRIVCRIVEEAKRVRPGVGGSEIHEPISAELILRWNRYGDLAVVADAAREYVHNVRASAGDNPKAVRNYDLERVLLQALGNL